MALRLAAAVYRGSVSEFPNFRCRLGRSQDILEAEEPCPVGVKLCPSSRLTAQIYFYRVAYQNLALRSHGGTTNIDRSND